MGSGSKFRQGVENMTPLPDLKKNITNLDQFRESNSPPPGPASMHVKALERNMIVNLLGVAYRVHSISHNGKKLQLRRIT